MNITARRTDDCQMTLSVEVDRERVDEHLRQAARRLANKARIPGFRKGKAPYQMVLQRLGKDALYEEALEVLGNEVYQEALTEQNVEPYAQASLQDVTFEPMVLKFTIPLMPEVKLGDYRTIRVEPETVTVTDQDVEDVLARMRDERADWNKVDRSAQDGDMGHLHIVLTQGDQQLLDRDHSLVLREDSKAVGPGFAANLIGASVGDTKSFDIEYPEDWADSVLAGKMAHFEVTVNEVLEKALPELNDDFAALLGDYENLADLRAKLRDNLQHAREHQAGHQFEDKAMAQLVDDATICFPPPLLEEELDRLMDEQDQMVRQQQNMGLDDYLKATGQNKDDLRKMMTPLATSRIKRALALSELARSEKLQIADDDLKAQELQVMTALGDDNPLAVRSLLNSPQGRAVLRRDIMTRKSVERLVAIAKGEAPELPVDGPEPAVETPALAEQPSAESAAGVE